MTLSVVAPQSVRSNHHTPFRTALPCVRRGLSVKLSAKPPLVISLYKGGSATEYVKLHPSKPVAGFVLKHVSDSTYTLSIPSTAPIGLYLLKDESSKSIPLAILFNPFDSSDPVYIADGAARQEYVMNESGLIWRGSADSNFPAAWDYGQFSPYALRCALRMIQDLSDKDRADPAIVVRHLSAKVNSQDDRGVLSGRWDGKYDDGVSPSAWSGSVAILKQYWETGSPVRYGQCWVFAGVLTTVCRALGVGCRTVSNFNSAHDTDRPYNRAVDKYYDENGDYMDRKSRDSIWNFHVWSSAYMKRKDLHEKFGDKCDGWQAIDATPQETSDKLYQLGPASVEAIKRGYTNNYDTDFVIGEVNADVVFYWKKSDGSGFVVRDRRRNHVGKRISTKAVGKDAREDITLEYKYKEGSKEEREALARRPSDKIEVETGEKKIDFDVVCEPRVQAGDKVKVIVKAINKGGQDVKVNMGCLYRAIRYTGETVKVIGKESWKDVPVKKGSTVEKKVELDWDDYASFFKQDVQTIQFVNTGKVVGSTQAWTEDCIVRVYGDKALEISAPSKVEIGKKAKLKVKVINSFRVKLTKVVIRVEGEGLLDTVTKTLSDVDKGKTVETEIYLEPTEKGKKTVVVTLDTVELKDIGKSLKIEVEGEDEDEKSAWERFLTRLREDGDWAWDELFR